MKENQSIWKKDQTSTQVDNKGQQKISFNAYKNRITVYSEGITEKIQRWQQ